MTDWNDINQQRLALVHPVLRDRTNVLIQSVQNQMPILVVQGFRSYVQQLELYMKGRNARFEIVSKKDVVTNAKPGWSMHQFGFAVDLAPDDITKQGLQVDWDASHPVWKQLVSLGGKFGLAEGAMWRTFPDNPHFYPQELPANPTDQIRTLYGKGGIASVWKWFDDFLTKNPETEVKLA